MGGLLVDTREGIRKGGSSGQPSISPKQPGKSLLLAAIKHSGSLKMPPGKPLSEDVIADFEQWINSGAEDPRDGKAAPIPPPYNFSEARKFWSFQPVKDYEPPAASKDSQWNRTAIDRFIRAKLDEKKLTPLGTASKRALIRRATFDLTGMPPAPEDIDAFLKDNSAAAFEKVVDRLLASTQYGERWARHWLDVVRYADTAGCNSDYPVGEMYRYRNWVIHAFNQDMPYNQFVRDQIAGDILAAKLTHERQLEDRQAKIVATGYIANSRRFGSRNSEFYLTIEDTIDNLGKAMLGLSIGCARCHDHKFDPIPNRDYYALYGIFQSTRYPFPGAEIYQHAKDFVALNPKDEVRLRAYQDETSKIDDMTEDYKAGRLGKGLSAEDKRKETGANRERLRTLEAAFENIPKAYAVSELEGKPEPYPEKLNDAHGRLAPRTAAFDARIQRKGDPKSLGDTVPRGFLTILGGQTVPPEEKGSGRLELAGWISDPANPLTARVMVNRIWQHHFGKGIVQSPNDFGARGERPTHPELLDYMTARFQESGYSVKKLHKLIMLTRAYQTASGQSEKNATADPRNDYLWRFDRRRLDAEEIRDAMLAVSGGLDATMGGPQSFPPETKWKFSQHKPFVADSYDTTYNSNRRGIYLMQQRIKKQPFFEIFDGADTNASTPKRASTVTSLQALAMMNSNFIYEQSDKFAARIAGEHIDDAYRLAFGRPATPAEVLEATRFLAKSRAAYVESGQSGDQALASYLRALLASDEFVFVD